MFNPATAALALTVGSIAPRIKLSTQPVFGDNETIWKPIANENGPSPFSRTGFGINGMVKPELVHYGGNIIVSTRYGRVTENIGGKLTLLSNKPTDKLFAFDYGTSFSASNVTHIIGEVANKYPHASANFIKNLLLQSTRVPINSSSSESISEDTKRRLRMVGYGVPDVERAIYSLDNRIVLFNEGDIGLKQIRFFSVGLPRDFFETNGHKRISVALTYNPPTRSTRGDSYLGNRLEFRLYHSIHPDEIVNKYSMMNLSEFDGETETVPPAELTAYEIHMMPGVNIRKVGCHQYGSKEFSDRVRNVPHSPLTLVLMNLNKWIVDETYRQAFCISLIIEHSEKINIYELVRTEVMQRIRMRN